MKFEDVELQEILEIIDKLNNEVYEQTGNFGIMYHPFMFKCDGYNPKTPNVLNTAFIDFFDMEIWSTETSERLFDDENNEYEPLEDYLRREANRIIETIKLIKL